MSPVPGPPIIFRFSVLKDRRLFGNGVKVVYAGPPGDLGSIFGILVGLFEASNESIFRFSGKFDGCSFSCRLIGFSLVLAPNIDWYEPGFDVLLE